MIGSSTEKRQRACGHTQVLRGAISPQRDSVFSGIGCILFPSPCLINMLPCYPETCGQTSFEVSCQPPAHRSSFHLTHLWRLLLEASLFIPVCLVCSTVRRARKGLKAGSVCQPHTPPHPAWDGANTHQPCTPRAACAVFHHTISCHAEGGRDLSSINITPLLSAILFRAQFYFPRAVSFLHSHGPPATH